MRSRAGSAHGPRRCLPMLGTATSGTVSNERDLSELEARGIIDGYVARGEEGSEQECEDAPGDASHGREAGHADGPGALHRACCWTPRTRSRALTLDRGKSTESKQ